MTQWIAEQIIVALSIIVTALLIIWQIGRQHENTLLLQRKNKIDELHLEIYKDIAKKIQTGISELISVSTKISFSIPTKFDSDRFIKEEYKKIGKEISLSPNRETAIKLSDDFYSTMDKIGLIIQEMEKYEIALPQFFTIKKRIIEKKVELLKAFRDYFNHVHRYLPFDVPKDTQEKLGKIINPEPPTFETIEEIKKIGGIFLETNMDLTSFLYDLRIEAQNSLLGPLFKLKVPPRKPDDPRYEVLSVDTTPFDYKPINFTVDNDHHQQP